MSLVTMGLGTNQLITQGFAVSYGEVIIVIPDYIPEAFSAPDKPLVLHQQNTYQGIVLHLDQEWTDFLVAIQAQIYFSAKQHHYDTDPIFEVTGILSQVDSKVTFDLSVSDTDTEAQNEYRWEISTNRLAPDFFRVMIQGRLEVKPIVRRV